MEWKRHGGILKKKTKEGDYRCSALLLLIILSMRVITEIPLGGVGGNTVSDSGGVRTNFINSHCGRKLQEFINGSVENIIIIFLKKIKLNIFTEFDKYKFGPSSKSLIIRFTFVSVRGQI